MKTACPNCGAEVEFRYDDSFVRVCGHCRNAVLRTDRGIDSLGQVADLVPIDSPLRLFAEGHYGSTGFLLVGMAQIRHSAGGLWQEWYAKLDGGQWGWLAEAQGRYYLTFEEPAPALPAYEQLAPGAMIDLPVRGTPRTFTVAEYTSGTYVAAAGELPFRLVPAGTFRYVDLQDGAGTFATIDYGEPGDAPALYVGQQATLAELGITGGEIAPSREAKITSQRLACPNCNAPIELRAPEQTQRIVCAYCNTMIALDGGLQVLERLATKATPSIPLGTVGTFLDGELTVIGYLQRSAEAEAVWYPFEEYLLYAPAVGFRWLVCSDGHWSYVQPVDGGAVRSYVTFARYDGVKFRQFATAPLRVDCVLGELYWKVQVGETVEGTDFMAPPAMLSLEHSESEETWSLSTYMTAREVQRAFGNRDLLLGGPTGHAPNEVNAAERGAGVMAFGMGLVLVAGIVFAAIAPNKLVYEHSIVVNGGAAATTAAVTPASSSAESPCDRYRRAVAAVSACTELMQETRDSMKPLFADAATQTDEFICKSGIDSAQQLLAMTTSCRVADATPAPAAPATASATPTPSPSENVFFSDPFQLSGGHNVEIDFDTSVDNDWVYVAADLVEQDTGTVTGVEAALEHWSGYEDGESWSEGDRKATEVVGPQPKGTYLLRLESQRGAAGAANVTVSVHEGVFRGKYLLWALAILGVPWLIIGLVGWAFEKKRWENSDAGKPPVNTFALMLGLVFGVGIAIWLILKAVASANSND